MTACTTTLIRTTKRRKIAKDAEGACETVTYMEQPEEARQENQSRRVHGKCYI